MKLEDLFKILDPYQAIQIGNARTGEPLTLVDYLGDGMCGFENYSCYHVHGIAPKINKEGKPYLAILIDFTV